MENGSTRRDWLKRFTSACGAMTLSATGGAAIAQPSQHDLKTIDSRNLPQRAGRTADEPFGYCLNTSTIRGQNLPLVKELEIASAAGFQAVEPSINEVDQFVNDGGKLGDLKKRIADLGLSVESVIAFTEWIVDDNARRSKALVQLEREMNTVAAFGGKRIACPPSGATNVALTDLRVIADRYRTVCELGEKAGITPELEIWGHSKTLSRLGEAAAVLVETAHPRAACCPTCITFTKGARTSKAFGSSTATSSASST